MINKTVAVIGGPIAQKVDAVLNLTPTGGGNFAAKIAEEMEKHFDKVTRIGNFAKGLPCDFAGLEKEIEKLNTDVVIFLPHLPNILVEEKEGKIRLLETEVGEIKIRQAPKLVKRVKRVNPKTLLIPFKLADKDTALVEIVKWMLDLRAGLAVYSRLGDSKNWTVVDALGNEINTPKENVGKVLAGEIKHFMEAMRRESQRQGDEIPPVPHLDKLVDFSRKMQPAFSLLIEKNVNTDRWPGNFSFRCTHGFLSSRAQKGFVITRRNVRKTGLAEKDFVFVEENLRDGKLVFYGQGMLKPSVDAPVHRLIYEQIPWVKFIIHGHMFAFGDSVFKELLPRWPCGAENQALDIIKIAPKKMESPVWVVNIEGHGFVALISGDDPAIGLDALCKLNFKTTF